jgi:hypothetical protein
MRAPGNKKCEHLPLVARDWMTEFGSFVGNAETDFSKKAISLDPLAFWQLPSRLSTFPLNE